MLSPEIYPESMIRYAESVLAETKIGFEQSTEINESTNEE